MSDKKRSKNFSDVEISLFLDVFQRYIDIIENKKNDGATVKHKLKAWSKVATELNAININGNRTVAQLKTFYHNYKRKVRKDNACDKAELYSTGQSPLFKKVDTNAERLIHMLKSQYEPDKDQFEAVDHDVYKNDITEMQHLHTPSIVIDEEEEDDTMPQIENNNKNISSKDVYKSLTDMAYIRSEKQNYEVEYLKNKLELQKMEMKRKAEAYEEEKELFLLERERRHNELKIQELLIKKHSLEIFKIEQNI